MAWCHKTQSSGVVSCCGQNFKVGAGGVLNPQPTEEIASVMMKQTYHYVWKEGVAVPAPIKKDAPVNEKKAPMSRPKRGKKQK
tara:strand:+ start:191 stop:439 length:249 start_codon:yes stop_codon:yes gene_type:complete